MTVVWKLEVGPVTMEGRKGDSGQERGVPEKRKRVRLPGRQQTDDDWREGPGQGWTKTTRTSERNFYSFAPLAVRR